MIWLFTFALIWSSGHASAQVEWLELPESVPVYTRAQVGAPLLTMSEAGETIGLRQRGSAFNRVQIKRNGKWRIGFIATADLESPAVHRPRGEFSVGLAGAYSHLRQAGKEFLTEDQVQYSTESFESGTINPSLVLQYGEESFWRLILTYRRTDYTSSTVTDLPGSKPREVKLSHTMYSLALQRMWTLGKIFYLGGGGEVSHATSAKLKLGGVDLPVEDADLPTYVGGHVAAGVNLDLGRSFAAFVEFRGLGFFNQSPMVYGGEAAAGLLWFP